MEIGFWRLLCEDSLRKEIREIVGPEGMGIAKRQRESSRVHKVR